MTAETLHNLGARLDWAQIREIVIEEHPLPLPERFAVGSRLRTTIVFIPAGRVAGQFTALDRRLAGRFGELYGSPFAVDTSTLNTSSDAVTQAIMEESPCPVRRVTH